MIPKIHNPARVINTDFQLKSFTNVSPGAVITLIIVPNIIFSCLLFLFYLVSLTTWTDKSFLDYYLLSLFSFGTYSKMSPGWQSNSWHIASKVEKRTALAFSVFRMDKLAWVIPTLPASSPRDIFRRAIITSKLIRISFKLSIHVPL